MSDVKLGQLAPEGAQRDAIHVAVVPLIAGSPLSRGGAFELDKAKLAFPAPFIDAVGVVDPFFETAVVLPGACFWGLMKPGTATGLRHAWDHPALGRDNNRPQAAGFPARRWAELAQVGEVEKAQAFLHNFALKHGEPYEHLMEQAKDHVLNGGSEFYFADKAFYQYECEHITEDEWDALWDSYRKVTGFHPDDKECRGC